MLLIFSSIFTSSARVFWLALTLGIKILFSDLFSVLLFSRVELEARDLFSVVAVSVDSSVEVEVCV